MVSLDIAKVLPPRAYAYVFALIPGLFFEISVLIANPAFVRELAARAREGFALGHYTMLVLAVFLAFIIGNAFMMFVSMVRRFLSPVYRLRAYLWKQLFIWPLHPLSVWLLQKPRLAQLRWLGRLNRYFVVQRSPGSGDLRDIQGCWRTLAARLLQQRYGIEEPEAMLQDYWTVLYWTLGTLTPEEFGGSLLMIAGHATGWVGLVAMRFAPALRNRYYLAFSVFLIVAGILNDWIIASRFADPVPTGYLNIRILLREFRETPKPHPEHGAAAPVPPND